MCIIIPLEELANAEYGRVLSYPRYDFKVHERRLNEMRELGVKALCFSGNKLVAGFPVLGKGYIGIVILALLEDKRRIALKISRTDSEPGRLIHEARMLQIANSVGVGPKLLGHTSSLLMMEYIEGSLFPKWIMKLGDDERATLRLRHILRSILEQCWRLDSVGLDHGELSCADKHIIVDGQDRAYILDFEAASDRRRVANVTSISQYLFIRSGVSETIMRKIGRIDAEKIIQSLRAYKSERNRMNFESILRTLGL
jgi:putative serine/threonine protein kinase